jgi:hypothetical protein
MSEESKEDQNSKRMRASWAQETKALADLIITANHQQRPTSAAADSDEETTTANATNRQSNRGKQERNGETRSCKSMTIP